MPELPRYDELALLENGVRSAWGLFGKDDNVGLINLLTPERVAKAAQLVQRGALFPLDCPSAAFSPGVSATRGVPRHRLLHLPGTRGFDDVLDNFYLQGSSQWDSLAHVGYAPDAFYNGASEDEILAGKRNTIEHWAERGLAGRVVLLDMVRALADAGRSYEPFDSVRFGVADLELARERAGISFQPGDFLVLYTGYTEWFLQQNLEGWRAQLAKHASPGLEQSEEMCRYLWDSHVCAIVSDNVAVEATPFERSPEAPPFSSLHPMLIGQFGMALGELWWLKDLADDCARDGRYEAFLVACPLHLSGGIGSPANAVAMK